MRDFLRMPSPQRKFFGKGGVRRENGESGRAARKIGKGVTGGEFAFSPERKGRVREEAAGSVLEKKDRSAMLRPLCYSVGRW